jgi:hypothetical protein
MELELPESPISPQTSENGSARASEAGEWNGSTKPLCSTPRHPHHTPERTRGPEFESRRPD